jgi:hypothetical protein
MGIVLEEGVSQGAGAGGTFGALWTTWRRLEQIDEPLAARVLLRPVLQGREV